MRRIYRNGTRAMEYLVFGFLLVLSSSPAIGRGEADQFEDFSEITLEELLNRKVESASKHEQNLFESANAITVITAEDIRRSGATCIPEALRMVPGVYVAQVSGNQWLVTVGGFVQDAYPNKLLVLVDGVSAYSPVSGGVRWEDISFSIEEVEKIEVIRGPGGVLYGANAVDGVINIYTKSPGNTSGGYVNVKGGTQDYRSASAATTLATDDDLLRTRLAVNYQEHQGLGMNRGQEYEDANAVNAASVRNQIKLEEGALLHVNANFNSGVNEYPSETFIPGTYYHEATNFTTKIEQYFDNGHQYYLQGSYSRCYIQGLSEDDGWKDYYDTISYDLEFQHSFPFDALGSHRFTWGGGHVWSLAKIDMIKDGEQDFTVASAFINDEWKPADQVLINAGLKYERNSFLDDPTLHWRGALLYFPTPEHGFRVSVANAYRSPSATDLFAERYVPLPPEAAALFPPGTAPNMASLFGDEDLDPEELISYEVGYRGVWFERVNVDASYAYREYDNLIATVISDPGFYVTIPPSTQVGPFDTQYQYSNDGKATSQTMELGIDARITRELRLLLNYGYVHLDVDDFENDDGIEKYSAENFGRIGLSYTHARGFMADVSGWYSDEVEVYRRGPNPMPYLFDDYWRIDARLAQKIQLSGGEIEFGVVGMNLGQEWHEEYMSSLGEYPYPIRTSYYGYLEYRED